MPQIQQLLWVLLTGGNVKMARKMEVFIDHSAKEGLLLSLGIFLMLDLAVVVAEKAAKSIADLNIAEDSESSKGEPEEEESAIEGEEREYLDYDGNLSFLFDFVF
uniref:Uncharacterized protein n=1 Tax=Salix viminalis TaxID=40686 RepID=A0A6N2NB17_SALVM